MKTNILCYVGHGARRERRRLRMGHDPRAALRPIRIAADIQDSRRRGRMPLQARWHVSPVSGRLEIRWEAAEVDVLEEAGDHSAAA